MPPRINIPPVTRALLIALVTLSTVGGIIRYRQWTRESHLVVPYLSLIPQLSIFYPWTFLTTTLTEGNVFALGVAGVAIYYGGRYLERAWTSIEFVKFLLIVSLIPNLMTFLTLVAMFALTGNMRWTLTTIAGTIPLQISFLVAFAQLAPTHTVTLFRGLVALRVPRLPLLYILLIALLSLTPFYSVASSLLATTGSLVAWTYLRFYKPAFPDLESSQPTSLRGDASETFALAEFFPEPVKTPVAAAGHALFQLLVALRICTPFSAVELSTGRGDNSHNYLHRSSTATAPGSTRAETERRRALALKALDQRLSASMAKTPQPQPSGSSGGAAGASTDVKQQPKAGAQVAMMTSPSGGADEGGAPGGMLRETSYVPEGEGLGDRGHAQD